MTERVRDRGPPLKHTIKFTWLQARNLFKHPQHSHQAFASSVLMAPDSQPTSASPGQGICTMTLESGSACPCRSYDEPTDVPYGQPVLCRECCHGKSRHVGMSSMKIFEKIIAQKVVVKSDTNAERLARKEATSGLRNTNKSGSDSYKVSFNEPDLRSILLMCCRRRRKRRNKPKRTRRPLALATSSPSPWDLM